MQARAPGGLLTALEGVTRPDVSGRPDRREAAIEIERTKGLAEACTGYRILPVLIAAIPLHVSPF
jgi:hypothetical protein